MKFNLTITLGNAAMQTSADLTRALREVAERLRNFREFTGAESGNVRDVNGNLVGQWEILS